MERIEYLGVIDKSGWKRGPWSNEPDKIQWQDEETGLPCLIVRGPSGSLCGYVGVPPGHLWHGKDYDNCDVDVHGGLTYADACQTTPENRGICHVPSHGEPDHVWWLGFDCAHDGDFSPSYGRDLGMPTGWGGVVEYRDVAYVENECRGLAKQIKAAPVTNGDGT
jgi:hypothetical protein